MKKNLGFKQLWIWVIACFVIITIGWVITARLASRFDFTPVTEGEVLERQTPAN